MKDNKFELKDLDANEKLNTLSSLLIHKGIITEDEFQESLKIALKFKNHAFEKELKDNPGLAFMLNFMS